MTLLFVIGGRAMCADAFPYLGMHDEVVRVEMAVGPA